MLGWGELGPGIIHEPPNRPPRLWYGYVQLGKSRVGRQLADLVRVARFAQSRFGVPPHELAVIARGIAGPLVLHAAALEGLGDRLALADTLISYRSVAMTRDYNGVYVPGFVPAALTAYDLPDLAASAAPRGLLIAGPVDAKGAPADADTIAQDTAVMTRAYGARNATAKLVVLPRSEKAGWRDALTAWLQ
jgi:hypothetical protein